MKRKRRVFLKYNEKCSWMCTEAEVNLRWEYFTIFMGAFTEPSIIFINVACQNFNILLYLAWDLSWLGRKKMTLACKTILQLKKLVGLTLKYYMCYIPLQCYEGLLNEHSAQSLPLVVVLLKGFSHSITYSLAIYG